MRFERLVVTGLRNLQSVTLDGLASMNLVYGENGAGKTSLLEAAHLICEGRSFRRGSIQPLVAKGSAECTVFAELAACVGGGRHTVGVLKRPGGGSEMRLDRSHDVTALDLVKLGGVQVLAQEYGDLFEGGPETRRRFIDWGLFHVEHGFLDVWKRFQSALRQRNSLLRRGRITASELQAWDREYIAASIALHGLRELHIQRLIESVPAVLSRLLDETVPIRLVYARGWDADQDLADALRKRSGKDLERGFTSCGPHRADLRIVSDLGSVTQTLSRGQKKLVGWGLRVGHGQLVSQHSGNRMVYLVDDLHAELDQANAGKLASLLASTEAQCFVTSAVPMDRDPCFGTYPNPSVFHVEHGRLIT